MHWHRGAAKLGILACFHKRITRRPQYRQLNVTKSGRHTPVLTAMFGFNSDKHIQQ